MTSTRRSRAPAAARGTRGTRRARPPFTPPTWCASSGRRDDEALRGQGACPGAPDPVCVGSGRRRGGGHGERRARPPGRASRGDGGPARPRRADGGGGGGRREGDRRPRGQGGGELALGAGRRAGAEHPAARRVGTHDRARSPQGGDRRRGAAGAALCRPPCGGLRERGPGPGGAGARPAVMNLLLVNWQDRENPHAGGAEIHLFELFTRLAARGHRVRLVCSGWPGAPEKATIGGIEVTRTGGRHSFALLGRGAVRRALRAERPDIVVEDVNKLPLFTPWLWHGPHVTLIPHL